MKVLTFKLQLGFLALLILFGNKAVAQTAPTNFYVVSEDGSNELFWDQNPAGESVTSYNIYRSTDSVTFDLLTSVPDSGTPVYTDTDVTNGITYYYYVTAFNGAEGPASQADAGMPSFQFSNFVDFSAGNNEVIIPDSDELEFENSEYSISFWLYLKELPGIGNQANMVARFTDGVSPIATYYFSVIDEGQLKFGEENFTSTQITSGNVINVGQWHHVALTYTITSPNTINPSFSVGVAEIFVDGLSVEVVSNSGTFVSQDSQNGALVVGGDIGGSGNFLNGIIDELSMWDVALTETEIQGLACTQLRGDETDLQGLWHFNAEDGNVYDYTANNNNGTYTAGTLISNFRPEAEDDVLTLDEDDAFTSIDIQVNDDPNGGDHSDVFFTGSLATSIIDAPSFGNANVISQDEIEYEPNANFFGTDIIRYIVNSDDNLKGSCGETLFDTATVTITVNPVNDPPVFTDELNVALPDGTILTDTTMKNELITVTINHNDIDGDFVSIQSITSFNTSSVFSPNSPDNFNFVYTPETDFIGSDTLNVVIVDDGTPALTDDVLVVIEVLEGNDPPEITDSTGVSSEIIHLVTLEDEELFVPIYYTDSNDDNIQIISAFSFFAGGDVTINADDTSYTYLPPLNYNGIDSVRVVIEDSGSPSERDEAVYVIDVLPVNDAPEIWDEDDQVVERFTVGIDSADNEICLRFFDVDGDFVSIASVDGDETQMSIAFSEECLIINPNESFENPQVIEVTACDDGDPVLCTSVEIELLFNANPVITDEDGNDQIDTLYYEVYQYQTQEVCWVTTDDNSEVVTVDIQSLNSSFQESFETETGLYCFTYAPDFLHGDIEYLEVSVCDNDEPQGCDRIIVVFEQLEGIIPQGFSPNGDGLEDEWVIPGISYFEDNSVTVFDRWGALVWEVKGYDNTSNVWSGECNSGAVLGANVLPDGTYYYIIRYGRNKGNDNGYVIIKR